VSWTKSERQWRIQAIMRRDGKRCWLCRDKLGNDVTIDHAIPKGRGGTDHLHNLRLAHARCNHDRGMIVQTPPKAAHVRLKQLAIPPLAILELTE
jgi:5-methylcytosine-specific restriction endonuclease McrA